MFLVLVFPNILVWQHILVHTSVVEWSIVGVALIGEAEPRSNYFEASYTRFA